MDSPFRAEGCGIAAGAAMSFRCRQRRHLYLCPIGHYHNPQRRSRCQALEPSGRMPRQSSEPSRRRRVQWRYHTPFEPSEPFAPFFTTLLHNLRRSRAPFTASFSPSDECPAVRERKYWSTLPGCSSSAREPRQCLCFPASEPCIHGRPFPRQ